MSHPFDSDRSFDPSTDRTSATWVAVSDSMPTIVASPPPVIHRVFDDDTDRFRIPVVITSEAEPDPAAEANRLLQLRVRAACLALGATHVAGLLGKLVFVWPAMVWIFPVLMIGLLSALVVALRRSRRFSTFQLRQIELAVFGLSVAYIAIQQDCSLRYWTRRGGNVWALDCIDIALIASVVQMLFYGMVIPNTWRRAALIVPATFLVPLTTLGVRLAIDPGMFQAVRSVVTIEWFGACLLAALATAVLTLYGIHTVHGLRAELIRTRVLARYRLGDQIGSGGMGDVFQAEHVLMKRPCAIKLIRREFLSEPTAVVRFAREVHATSTLTHPNTIEIYDYGRTADGRLYYVMEYLHGLNLQTLVEHYGPLPPGRVIYFLRQACGALAEAHDLGIIHRDLKPANLFAAKLGGLSDFLKVLDFGLAKLLEPPPGGVEPSAQGKVRGTPAFMAPEQVLGDAKLDGRADLYALGCVGYYLLTGHPPFTERSRVDVLIAQVRDPVAPLSEVKRDVPADLGDVIMKCLAKSPTDRYPDARALSQALASCNTAVMWNADRATSWWELNGPGSVVDGRDSHSSD